MFKEATTSHDCPAPNCTRSVSDIHFSCGVHWGALPVNLRTRIQNERDNHGKSARLEVLTKEATTHWIGAHV